MKIEYHDGEVVELLFDKKLHSYKVGEEIAPSATRVLDIISKPALVPWALKVGANWLEKNFFHDEDASSKKTNVYRSRMALEPLLKGMKSAYRSSSKDALNIGSITHEWVEEAINWKLGNGTAPSLPDNEQAQSSIDGFRLWLQENDVEWLSAEEKIYHNRFNYAGTVDAVANINGEFCVVDFKTSSGIWDEYFLQAAAYADAISLVYGEQVESAWSLRFEK